MDHGEKRLLERIPHGSGLCQNLLEPLIDLLRNFQRMKHGPVKI